MCIEKDFERPKLVVDSRVMLLLLAKRMKMLQQIYERVMPQKRDALGQHQ